MTPLDLSPRPARRFWRELRRATVTITLFVAIVSPFVVAIEYAYLRIVVPSQNAVSAAPSKSPPIPAPFVDPGIIVVAPQETEPPVIPDTQRRSTTGKHRAPEETPAPSAPPRETRRVAPATPTTTSVPMPNGSTAQTTPPSAPSSPSITSTTPIYDTLRRETLASNPNLEESVIPE